MNALVTITLGFVTVVVSGCSVNTAKLHTDLSRNEFDGLVRESFCVGMPLSDAEVVSQGLGLRVKCWDRHGDYLCVSELYPKGVHKKSFVGFGGPKWLTKLTLHFGDDFALDKVTRHKMPSPNSNIFVRQVPPRVIPLDDCELNGEVAP